MVCVEMSQREAEVEEESTDKLSPDVLRALGEILKDCPKSLMLVVHAL